MSGLYFYDAGVPETVLVCACGSFRANGRRLSPSLSTVMRAAGLGSGAALPSPEGLAQHHEVTLARRAQRAAHFEGRCRIEDSACNRFESTALLVVAAVFFNDSAKVRSFASSRGFRFELSALSIAFRTAAIRSAGRACDRSN